MSKQAATRLYLLTPPVIEDIKAFADLFVECAEAANGALAAIQIRLKDKTGEPAAKKHIARVVEALKPVASSHEIAIFLNDDPHYAIALELDGAHIGQSDMPIREARGILGPDRILGVTCHNSRHLAMEAGELGADYVAFGAFFETQTKKAPTRAEPEILSWWQDMMELPSVAIGGITLENAPTLIEAGADFLALSSGVWKAEKGPVEAVKQLSRLLNSNLP